MGKDAEISQCSRQIGKLFGMKTFDQIWVITDPTRDLLSYMTFVENTKGFRAKQETGRRWARQVKSADGGIREGIENTHDNEYIEGFELVDTVSRDRGNKLFRIKDPRQFIVELKVTKIFDIIRDCEIKNGVLQGKWRWAMDDGMCLVREGSERESDLIDATDFAARKLSLKDLSVGDVVVNLSGEKRVWCGRFRFKFGFWTEYITRDRDRWREYRGSINEKRTSLKSTMKDRSATYHLLGVLDKQNKVISYQLIKSPKFAERVDSDRINLVTKALNLMKNDKNFTQYGTEMGQLIDAADRKMRNETNDYQSTWKAWNTYESQLIELYDMIENEIIFTNEFTRPADVVL